MEQKTLNMFVNTCSYLNYLVDSVMTSNTEIPPEVFITANDLMAKLFGFMNHMYRTGNSDSRISSAELNASSVHNKVLPSDAFNSSPHETQFNSPSMSVYQRNLTPLLGVPISHYGNPSVGQMSFDQEMLLTGPSLRQTTPSGFPAQTAMAQNLPVSHEDLSSSRDLPCEPSTSNAKVSTLPPLSKIESVETQYQPVSSQSSRSTSAKSKKSSFDSVKPLFPVKPVGKQTIKLPTNTQTSNTSQTIKDSKIDVPSLFVTKLFNGYLDSVLDGSLNLTNMGVYCRPCDAIIMKPWTVHENKQSHINVAKKSKKSTIYSCSICGISIFGAKYIILKYFEYHYHRIHVGSTKNTWQDILVDVNLDSPLLKGSNSSSVSSLNTIESNPPNAKKGKQIQNNKQNSNNASKEKQISATNIIQTPPKQTTSHSINAPIAEPTPSVGSSNKIEKPSATAATASSTSNLLKSFPPSPYPQFDDILHKIIDEWTKSSIIIEVGYCEFCSLGITSAFEWFAHVDDHISNVQIESIKGSEKICSRCNLKIFGEDHGKFFNLPAHCKLDESLGS